MPNIIILLFTFRKSEPKRRDVGKAIGFLEKSQQKEELIKNQVIQ
jgi:hypothetical protein